jgi:CRP-like cAMP-binding protein
MVEGTRPVAASVAPGPSAEAAQAAAEAFDLARWAARGRPLTVLSDQQIRALDRGVRVVEVPAGTRLLTDGQLARSVAMIRSGQVELSRGAGRRRVVVEILRAGDLLGVVSRFADLPSTFSARALTPVTLVRFGEEALYGMLADRPELAEFLVVVLAARLERTHRRLVEVTSGDLRRRVATLLLDERDHDAGSIRLAQSTIAELLGASRPRVNRVLKAFEATGLVRLSYRRIDVIDPDGLRRIAA